MPKWWNWQTRHLEGVVGRPVGVRIPPSAPYPLSLFTDKKNKLLAHSLSVMESVPTSF